MRSLSFIVALGFVLIAPSLTGSPQSDLPGVGTFAYSGTPVADAAPQAIVVATR
jgi:hypothetical protein